MTKTTTLRAEGFSCPSCVGKIETAVGALKGVEKVDVKFASGRIEVVHNPELATVRQLVDAVASVGYTAKPAAF